MDGNIRKLIKHGMFDEYEIDKSMPIGGQPNCMVSIYDSEVLLYWRKFLYPRFKEMWVAQQLTEDEWKQTILIHYRGGVD